MKSRCFESRSRDLVVISRDLPVLARAESGGNHEWTGRTCAQTSAFCNLFFAYLPSPIFPPEAVFGRAGRDARAKAMFMRVS